MTAPTLADAVRDHIEWLKHRAGDGQGPSVDDAILDLELALENHDARPVGEHEKELRQLAAYEKNAEGFYSVAYNDVVHAALLAGADALRDRDDEILQAVRVLREQACRDREPELILAMRQLADALAALSARQERTEEQEREMFEADIRLGDSEADLDRTQKLGTYYITEYEVMWRGWLARARRT